MAKNNIFFDDDELSELSKKEVKTSTPIKKITQEEVYQDLYNRVLFKRKIKESIFKKIDKQFLEEIGMFIMQKKMSYRGALSKIIELYPNIEGLKKIKSETLRYYLIKHGFINNEKALNTIFKSISNSGYAINKRDRIIKDVIEEILKNHLDKIIEHPKFKILLKEITS